MQKLDPPLHAEVFYKKDVLKHFPKLTEKHLWRGLILSKDPGWGPATLLKRDSSIGVSGEFSKYQKFKNFFGKFLKQFILETSENGYFWRVRTLRLWRQLFPWKFPKLSQQFKTSSKSTSKNALELRQRMLFGCLYN